MRDALLEEIERFQDRTGWSDYTFGFRSIKNGRLVDRLREGGRVWPETEMAIRAFIRSYDREGAT